MVDATGSDAVPPKMDPNREEPAALSRRLVREAWKATLSTIDRNSGAPYGSLVAVAAVADGSPLLLISGLAEHTRNLAADARASLLFDGTGLGRGALTGARVTLVGRIDGATGATDRERYLSRHPDAVQFIDFGDFKLVRLAVEWAHMVAGFGRIVRLERSSLILSTQDAEDVVNAESGIINHMNDDHGESIALLAAEELRRRGAPPTASTDWRMIGCDPLGIDLTDGIASIRIAFPERVTSLESVRKAMIVMVDAARRREMK